MSQGATVEYRNLGRTGLRVSALGIGTWQLCGPVSVDGRPDGYPDPGADAAVDLIQRCGDLGINLIDTAPMYGLGEGERRVGRAIAGRREDWVVSTKFGVHQDPDGIRRDDTGPASVRRELEQSLRRLGTDYVDLYLYHCPPDPATVGPVKEALEDMKREGKLRFYGISTKDSGALRSLLDIDSVDVAMIAQSMLTHPSSSLRMARTHGLGVLVRGALEWGRLSGRYFRKDESSGSPFAADDIRSEEFRSEDLTRFRAFGALAPQDVDMAAFALRYVLDFDTTHSVVLGGKRIAHYESAIEAFALGPLDPPTLAGIARARRQLSGVGAMGRALRLARTLLGA